MATETSVTTVDPKLLEMLVCPLTKGPLSYDAAKQELVSKQAKLAYPIRTASPSCYRTKPAVWRTRPDEQNLS
jgi:uncharacterized protein YbaR (Trm112 family)